MLNIFHDIPLCVPAWNQLPLRGRWFQAGRLVEYHEKYSTGMWFYYKINVLIPAR